MGLHLMPASLASSSRREGSGSGGSQTSSSACLPCTAPGLCLTLHMERCNDIFQLMKMLFPNYGRIMHSSQCVPTPPS